MITAIEIENFKGIADRLRIDLKPITLLFGANSSGKSTIIHALHYAREVLVRGNLDADCTETGGDFIDLGGFRNFVNNRDMKKEMRLCFHFDLGFETGNVLPYFGRSRDQDEFGETVLDFLNHVPNASVELRIAWSNLAGRPFVKDYRVHLDGQFVGAIVGSPDKPGAATLHMSHKPSCLHAKSEDDDENGPSQFDALLERALPDSPENWFDLEIEARNEALPELGSGLSCPKLFEDVDADQAEAAGSLLNVLNRAIVGPGKLLRDHLARLRYLGPLREKPPRNYEAPRHYDPARWASGIAAWDHLYTGDASFIERISEWLSEPERLGTGYGLRLLEYKELDIADPLMVRLTGGHAFDDLEFDDVKAQLGALPTRRRLFLVDLEAGTELLPHDVGEGMSQIVPALVAILAPGDSMTAIEQPELHVHPAVQVGLGELLIAGANAKGSPILIETHSEHLLLRLLRRIREANDGELPEAHVGVSPDQLSVVFMESTDEGVRATPLRIDETGEFVDRWPRGFFEERAEELF